jgi:hypothetical protein
MERSGLQRIIPIALVLIVIIVAVVALVSLGRALFSGGGGASPSPAPVNTGKQALKATTADRSVRMAVRGPIVANENFHSYAITVSPDSRTMTTYVGYLGQQVANEQLDNNVQAYTQFVNALSRANLMEGTPLTGDANNTDGICATGYLYEFEVLQASNSIQRLWTSSCRGSLGSLKANLQQVSQLFQLQIPRFKALSSAVNLSR